MSVFQPLQGKFNFEVEGQFDYVMTGIVMGSMKPTQETLEELNHILDATSG